MNGPTRSIASFAVEGIANLGGLHDALRLAMQLEFATLPPYLCAQWSVVGDPDRVEGMLHSVAAQEMQHFALAGNVLAALGGRPKVAAPDFLPTFPLARLPGEVALSRALELQVLSLAQVELFMEVEHPNFPPVAFVGMEAAATIGEFYDTIISAIRSIQPPVDASARCIELPHTRRIVDLDDAVATLERIKSEGEGTQASPEQPLGEVGALAHYYVFKQILKGRRLVEQAGRWDFTGDSIRFPEVRAMRRLPSNACQLLEFRRVLTSLLWMLERCWTAGAPFSVVEMFQLEIEGRKLAKEGIVPDFSWLDNPSS
ncbi:ferritin-like domain-containing protein [Variovorax sp. GB1P17]|uniref:ferritin-like domain-containing protein n=1 Tax=Variovorax sp. GB1P17 TaxID=3443740 RepID=UPI003F462419